MTLQDLTDTQLERLYERVLRKIHCDGGGYQPWGWDLPTLCATRPQLAKTYVDIRHEGARRFRQDPIKYRKGSEDEN